MRFHTVRPSLTICFLQVCRCTYGLVCKTLTKVLYCFCAGGALGGVQESQLQGSWKSYLKPEPGQPGITRQDSDTVTHDDNIIN